MQDFIPKENKLYGLLHNYVLTGYPAIELHQSSATNETLYPKTAILEADNPNSHWVSNTFTSTSNEYMIFTLSKVKLQISHYSLRSHPSDACTMSSWEFYGSQNNGTYSLLHYTNNTNVLYSSGIGFFEVNPLHKTYQSFKIRMTTMTDASECTSKMRISGFELFGKLVSLSCQTKAQCKQSKPYMLYYLIALLVIDNDIIRKY